MGVSIITVTLTLHQRQDSDSPASDVKQEQ
jgi:hypothetical protein